MKDFIFNVSTKILFGRDQMKTNEVYREIAISQGQAYEEE